MPLASYSSRFPSGHHDTNWYSCHYLSWWMSSDQWVGHGCNYCATSRSDVSHHNFRWCTCPGLCLWVEVRSYYNTSSFFFIFDSLGGEIHSIDIRKRVSKCGKAVIEPSYCQPIAIPWTNLRCSNFTSAIIWLDHLHSATTIPDATFLVTWVPPKHWLYCGYANCNRSGGPQAAVNRSQEVYC